VTDRRVRQLTATVPARIWELDLAPAAADLTEALLDAEDRERLPRLAPPVRQRLLARRALLRAVAVAALGDGDVDLELRRHDGRIELTTSDGRVLRPSTAHSGATGLVALGEGPIGVDLELVAPVPEAAAIARDLFHPDEATWILEGQDDLLRRFLAVWVRKEAVVKVTGEGLGRDLRSFAVHPGHGTEAVAGDDRIVTHGLDVAGAVAAVAWVT
jgi:4'-phosphopantetheinyl transferase